MLEQECGIGIVVTDEMINSTIDEMLAKSLADITAGKLNQKDMLMHIKGKLKWGDVQKLMQVFAQKWKEIESKITKKAEAPKKEAKKEKKEDKDEFSAYKKEKISMMVARDLYSSLNSQKLLEDFKKNAPASVVSRFPPEPNGYLHIGHAKAMRHDFTLAEEYNGVCYLRFDDTNPEKENQEYIDRIKECVAWLGYKPYKVTFASDYFDQLMAFAFVLINKGKAYVCGCPKQKIKELRLACKECDCRKKSVEQNYKQFTHMKQGMYEENEYCLRLKINMQDVNPCLRDPVAYRIRYAPHPHAGDKYCIYPTYDFTHCINDSLEYVTHSCCSLEFEVRRDSYYWLLEALDIYRPFVWEFSRLNLEYTVMSKRWLQQLVEMKMVDGWDDPRMFTLMGLKRRGVTPEAINDFVDRVGITRRGNEMMISQKLFDYCVRQDLDKNSHRTMAVLHPILVTLDNIPEYYEQEIYIPIFPKDPSKGTRKVLLTHNLYIEETDFATSDKEKFYGLTPKQHVLLKYAYKIKYVSHTEENGKATRIHANLITDDLNPVDGVIHWISSVESANATVILYDKLFNHPDPKSLPKWLDALDSVNSKKALANCKVHKSMLENSVEARFQFERLGYFVIDKSSAPSKGNLTFNRTITLSESKEKKQIAKSAVEKLSAPIKSTQIPDPAVKGEKKSAA